MNGFVYAHSGLDAKALRNLLDTLEGSAYVVQETQVRIRFIRLDDLDELWDEGRAFDETLEVRWRLNAEAEQTEPLYRVRVLSEQRQSLEGAWRMVEMDVDEEDRIWLWGRHWRWLTGIEKASKDDIPHAWTQAEIPGQDTLAYPHEPAEFLYLRTVDYSREGVTLMTRFKGLLSENRSQRRIE